MLRELLDSVLFLLPFSSGNSLMDILNHHILDSDKYMSLDLFGIDLSITKHVVVMWIIALLLIVLVVGVANFVRRGKIGGRLSMLVEIFLDFIDKDIVRSNFHGDSRKWLPFFSTLFFFITFSNLFGLIPESSTITGNIAVTLSLSIVTFVLIQGYGMAKQGVFHYWVSIVPGGIPKVLWPFMFLIELIGLVAKPFALTVRLFANMIAGHIVILVLLFLAAEAAGDWIQLLVAPLSVLAAVGVNLLEIFIALLQAYIFTFLSAIFISSAGAGH